MVTIPDWAAAGIVAILGGAGLFAKTWIKTTAEGSARQVFDKEIEKVKSDFRRGEERLKADLQRRESELTSLRDGALSGRANRAALLDQRRLQAAEKVWEGVGVLSRMRMPAKTLSMLNIEAVSKDAGTSAEAREVLKKLMGGIDVNHIVEQMKGIRVDYERPFITPMVWALYSGYSAIILGGYIVLHTLTSGLKDPMKYINTEYSIELLGKILPHQSDNIKKFHYGIFYLLLDEIEEKLLVELNAMLEGVEVDENSVKRAAEILEAVNKVSRAGPATQPGSEGAAAMPPTIADMLKPTISQDATLP